MLKSRDHRDGQVQHMFTMMKKTSLESQKLTIGQSLARMYEKNDQYSDGIFSRIYMFISDSVDRQEKKVGLIALHKIGLKMQGSARSMFVNKFHSPVFKLFQNCQDQSLLKYIEEAYQIILDIGGNRNDSTIQSNLSTAFSIISSNSKDIKKIAALSVIKILIQSSPYTTFKKLLQKDMQDIDNFSIIMTVAKSKNIKLRQAYLSFLVEYIQFVSEKKQIYFQKSMFRRLYDRSISPKDNTEEINHIFFETVIIFLQVLPHIITEDTKKEIIQLVSAKILISIKSIVIQRSIIILIPLLIEEKSNIDIFHSFLSFLRGIDGQNKLLALKGINNILEKHVVGRQGYIGSLRKIPKDIANNFAHLLSSTSSSSNNQQIISQQVKTIIILLKDPIQRFFVKQQLDTAASYAMLLGVNQSSLTLVQEVCQNNLYDLAKPIQKKLIILLSKILAGGSKKILRDEREIQQFYEFVKKISKTYTYLQSQQNKIKCVQALSIYKFQPQFREIIISLLKQKVLKTYLQWGDTKMRSAAIEVAFFLYAKRGNVMAQNQMFEILDKLLRIGLCDRQIIVREKVFTCLQINLMKIPDLAYFLNDQRMIGYLFQAASGTSQKISLKSLKIICEIYKQTPSSSITPFLKKIVYNCFSNFAADFKYYEQKQHLIQQLSLLIEYAPSVIENQVNILLRLVLKYLDDRSQYEGLQLIFFTILYSLADTLPYTLIPYIKQLSVHLVEAMKDKLNNKKRNLAMRTFIKFTKECGYVVLPYYQLNGLFDALVYLLKSQVGQQSRINILKILGSLGAITKIDRQSSLVSDTSNQISPQYQSLNFYQRRILQNKRIESNSLEVQLKSYYDELLLLNSGAVGEKGLINKHLYSFILSSFNYQQNKTKENSNWLEALDNGELCCSILIALLKILKDKSLSDKHQMAQDILQEIIKLMKNQIQPFLPEIIQAILILSEENQNFINLLVTCIWSCNVADLIPTIIGFTLKKLNLNSVVLTINVLQAITCKYNLFIRNYLETIIDRLYSIIKRYPVDHNQVIKVIMIYQNMKQLIEPYVNIVLPQLLEKYMVKPSEVTSAVIDWLMICAQNCHSLIEYLPSVASYFNQLLKLCKNRHQDCRPCMRKKIGNCCVLFLITFKQSFMNFLPLLHGSMISITDQDHQLYLKAVRNLDRIQNGSFLQLLTKQEREKLYISPRQIPITLNGNQRGNRSADSADDLVRQFNTTGKKLMDEDWLEWFKKICIFIMKKSPNYYLVLCSDLADDYFQLAFELFNVSFYYFWQMMLDNQKKQLVENIRKILLADPKPYLFVRKAILQLAQFMSRKKCSFQLGNALLADCAKQASAFAKHLYYRELEFETNPRNNIESLIQVSMKLGHTENAFGLFKVAANMEIQCQIDWYERIKRYEDAYQAYQKLEQSQQYSQAKLICLGHFNDEIFLQQIQINSEINEQNVAVQAVNSYARLGRWQKMQQWFQKIPQTHIDRDFWQAVIAVKNNNFENAVRCIKTARQNNYQDISQLIVFVNSVQSFEKLERLQQLVELQEVIEVKSLMKMANEHRQSSSSLIQQIKNKKKKLKEIWSDRLIGTEKNQELWSNLTYIRSLLFSKSEYFDFWYKYCEVCIADSKTQICDRILKQIKQQVPEDPLVNNLLQVLEYKLSFAQRLISKPASIEKIVAFLNHNQNIDHKIIGSLYLQCSRTLKLNQKNNISLELERRSIELMETACNFMQTQKQWYMLGLMYLEYSHMVNQIEVKRQHIILALRSFIKSLKLEQQKQLLDEFSLQNCLKIVAILSKYGNIDNLQETFTAQFKDVPAEYWIPVVPQMIAQLTTDSYQNSAFLRMLKNIIVELGYQYPQSILFPLIFAAKSKIPSRVDPAMEILKILAIKHKNLTKQYHKISIELSKAAFKLKQYWFDTIQVALTHYQKKNPTQVIQLLKQLYLDVMDRKSSNSQLAFHRQFRLQLQQGYAWLLRFEETQQIACFSQAFFLFYSIYRKVKQNFEQFKKVYLKNVAPSLLQSSRYQSSIPGLYHPHRPLIRIDGFDNELNVLQSKQRPRKLKIYGSDGKQYWFLLKGKQDLRLDERVMQFLGLVNKLIFCDSQKMKKDLEIIRYSIIPLTINTGLIGWVQHCDTLHQLVKQYRIFKRIRLTVEKQIYQNICPNFASLPKMNKLQIFKHGLQKTQGKDLQKIIWLKSKTSQIWIQRRNNYTTSLATMSIVGYILGLGDRHPSNIMMQRNTGKVVHIDFGDCFEVASLRQNFPEKVPFRLTRMLQKAMGVSGIYGLYQKTCENVMKVLRDNKESLLSVLETFAHDPIISWRITVNDRGNERQQVAEQRIQQREPQRQEPFHLEQSIIARQRRRTQLNDFLGSIMHNIGEQIKKEQEKQQNKSRQSIQSTPQINNVNEELPNQINQKAKRALKRINLKLQGLDFDQKKQLSVNQQVERLIKEATSHQNICQSWPGWHPFW